MYLLWKKSRQNGLKIAKYSAKVCVRHARVCETRPGKVYAWETLLSNYKIKYLVVVIVLAWNKGTYHVTKLWNSL